MSGGRFPKSAASHPDAEILDRVAIFARGDAPRQEDLISGHLRFPACHILFLGVPSADVEDEHSRRNEEDQLNRRRGVRTANERSERRDET